MMPFNRPKSSFYTARRRKVCMDVLLSLISSLLYPLSHILSLLSSMFVSLISYNILSLISSLLYPLSSLLYVCLSYILYPLSYTLSLLSYFFSPLCLSLFSLISSLLYPLSSLLSPLSYLPYIHTLQWQTYIQWHTYLHTLHANQHIKIYMCNITHPFGFFVNEKHA